MNIFAEKKQKYKSFPPMWGQFQTDQMFSLSLLALLCVNGLMRNAHLRVVVMSFLDYSALQRRVGRRFGKTVIKLKSFPEPRPNKSLRSEMTCCYFRTCPLSRLRAHDFDPNDFSSDATRPILRRNHYSLFGS